MCARFDFSVVVGESTPWFDPEREKALGDGQEMREEQRRVMHI